MIRQLNILLYIFLLFPLSVVYAAPSTNTGIADKNILWIDSYHKGYPWSDGIEMGIKKVLQNTGVHLHIFRMNTKINDSEDFGVSAGRKALEEVQRVQPDLVIATDDNAQKYLVVPHLRDTPLPVVFSGVNWDASDYGYPTQNVTGMIEIDRVDLLIAHMQKNAKGSKVGFLSVDVETARKIGEIINERFFHDNMNSYMVKTFQEFKDQFLRAQNEVDMLIIYNYVGLQGWDDIEAENFIANNTNIPTGSLLQFLKHLVVYTLGKSSEEQGEYAAQTALQILAGKIPTEIPLATSKEFQLTVNLKMGKSADIIFPLSVLKTAEVIGREAYTQYAASEIKKVPIYQDKKVLWIDSYHEGYEWSDGIEKGIREVLVDKGVELQVLRLDTKRNTAPDFGEQVGKDALRQIHAFQPDVIIASDDNAQKYLVVPHLFNKEIPVIFCGVNWDASMYGYPTANVTGMIEVEPIEELVQLMRKYAKGAKVGYLGGNVETERKIVSIYNQRIFNNSLVPYFVDSMKEFKHQFLKAQEEVDILIIPNHAGISDWDGDAIEQFIAKNIRIPTGGVFDFMSRFVIFTLAKSPGEQGNYAAKTALDILGGKTPAELPIQKNERNRSTVNLKMANAADIVIPISILRAIDTVIGQETLLQEQ